MEIQPIRYRGRTAAVCTPTRLFLGDELAARGLTDPVTRFVCAMCLYAGDVLNGELPGPYRDRDARDFARRLLIPRELLEVPRPPMSSVARTAAGLGVPLEELFVELGRVMQARERERSAGAPERGGHAR